MLPPPAAPAEPALDFLSPSFDALRALRQPGLAPPDALRAPLDNLSRCVPLLPPEMPEAAANLPARHRRTAESVAAAERAKAGRQAAAAATAARERATTIVQRAAQVREVWCVCLGAGGRGRADATTQQPRSRRGNRPPARATRHDLSLCAPSQHTKAFACCGLRPPERKNRTPALT